MGNVLKIKHQFNSGDLIASLPGFQHLYRTKGIKTEIYQQIGLKAGYYPNATHPVQNEEGEAISMSKGMFDMLKPLIEAQEYVEGFYEWEGQPVDWDFIRIRDAALIPMPYSDIHHWPFYIFPELACDLSESWIYAYDPQTESNFRGNIIINRTERYTNPYISYYFLDKYKERILFAGTERERVKFNSEFKLGIPMLDISDFLELANAISCCELFIGNQSFCWHLADSMKVTRILEVCKEFPNTLPTGIDGYAFVYQEALEFYVNQIMK